MAEFLKFFALFSVQSAFHYCSAYYLWKSVNIYLFSFCWDFRETHLWYILPNEVKSETLLNQYLELLSPCEKENVCRMRGFELQKRALLARALVRTTIARCRSSFT